MPGALAKVSCAQEQTASDEDDTVFDSNTQVGSQSQVCLYLQPAAGMPYAQCCYVLAEPNAFDDEIIQTDCEVFWVEQAEIGHHACEASSEGGKTRG